MKRSVNLLLLLLHCEYFVDALQSRLYTTVTVKDRWWNLARLPDAPTEAESLAMCAGQCSMHYSCDAFDYQEGSTCQFGTSDTAVDRNAEDYDEDLIIYHMRMGTCDANDSMHIWCFVFSSKFDVSLPVCLGDVCLDTPAVPDGRSWHVGSYFAELGNMLVDGCDSLAPQPNFWLGAEQ